MVLTLGFASHAPADEEPRGRPVATGRGGAGNVRTPPARPHARPCLRRPSDPCHGPPPPAARLACALQIRSQSRSSASQPAAADVAAAAAAAYAADHPPSAVSSGRGGAGNVRSPSRDPADRARLVQDELHEQGLQDEYRRAEASAPHYAPSGRGGRGNIHHEGSSLERGRGASTERDRGRKDGPVGSVRI